MFACGSSGSLSFFVVGFSPYGRKTDHKKNGSYYCCRRLDKHACEASDRLFERYWS